MTPTIPPASVPIDQVRRIVQAAQKANSFIVMDEAYGDYMDDDQAALSWCRINNLAVVRTFSKGFGAAGVRLGPVSPSPRSWRRSIR
ncbi:MAG: aminotransferase class I/II-fold pyridoxal phosphate-dependent enzyme [Eggerthellaceae bacterium]